MRDEIGVMILSGCNPLLGVTKKAVEVLGCPKGFCLLANIENKQIAITPDNGDSSAVLLDKTSETQDCFWVRGIAVHRIIDAFGLNGKNSIFYFPAKHIPTDNAIICSYESSCVFDLESKEIDAHVRQFMSRNFHMKDRKNRTTSNALDIKCCRITPRKK